MINVVNRAGFMQFTELIIASQLPHYTVCINSYFIMCEKTYYVLHITMGDFKYDVRGRCRC